MIGVDAMTDDAVLDAAPELVDWLDEEAATSASPGYGVAARQLELALTSGDIVRCRAIIAEVAASLNRDTDL